MTILARSGVPGAVLWAALQVGFAIALLRAYRRAAHTSADWWARVDLWILACWATFIVNAAFEVSLESPQGGIWFWSLFGFGIAVLRQQRRVSMRVGTADEPVIAGPWQTRVGYGRAGV